MATIQGQLLGPTLFPNRAIEKCENWDFSRSRIWRVKCGRASNCGCRENISSSFLATHQPHHTGHTPATPYTNHTKPATHPPPPGTRWPTVEKCEKYLTIMVQPLRLHKVWATVEKMRFLPKQEPILEDECCTSSISRVLSPILSNVLWGRHI